MNYQLNHFPGRRGFLKRSLMFAIPDLPDAKPSERIVEGILREIRAGSIRAGKPFPTPGKLAALTGESPSACLEATSELLDSGHIVQNLDGKIYVSGDN